MVRPHLNRSEKTETSRFACFSEQTAVFRLHLCLTLRQLSSIVSLSNCSSLFFLLFFLRLRVCPMRFLKCSRPIWQPGREALLRLKPPHSTISIFSKEEKVFSSQMKKALAHFFPRQSVSAPSVSRSQLAQAVHHTTAGRLHL